MHPYRVMLPNVAVHSNLLARALLGMFPNSTRRQTAISMGAYRSYFAAADACMARLRASLMAPVVTDAPAMPSIWSLWAVSICSLNTPPSMPMYPG